MDGEIPLSRTTPYGDSPLTPYDTLPAAVTTVHPIDFSSIGGRGCSFFVPLSTPKHDMISHRNQQERSPPSVPVPHQSVGLNASQLSADGRYQGGSSTSLHSFETGTQSAKDVIKSILRRQGFLGFYSGLISRVLMAAPAAGMCWGTYESLQSFFSRLEAPLVMQEQTSPPPTTIDSRAHHDQSRRSREDHSLPIAEENYAVGKRASLSERATASVITSCNHVAEILGEDPADAAEDPLAWEVRASDFCLWKHCVAGSVAGIAEHVFMFPIDTVKTRMQAVPAATPNGPAGVPRFSVSQVCKSIVEEHGGYCGFFRGCTAIGAACIPAHVGLFGTYEFTKFYLLDSRGVDNKVGSFLRRKCSSSTTSVYTFEFLVIVPRVR